MASSQNREALQLRAHHICCMPFWKAAPEERGQNFLQVRNRVKNTLLSQPEAEVMVIEGVDELCKACPLCIDERCSSPRGDEDKVKKWDAILLGELGLPFGSCLTSAEWQALIEQKAPFKICQKCQWKTACSVGASLL